MEAARIAQSEVVERGEVIAWRKIESNFFQSFEVIFFCPPQAGSGNRPCGLYVGTRFHFESKEDYSITIFCFYSGVDKSPCFKQLGEAFHWLDQVEVKYNIKYVRAETKYEA